MDFGKLLPPRDVEDILAERVRLVIGGEVYDLPVLTIRENRVWRTAMDLQLSYLVVRIEHEDDTDAVLQLFDGNENVWMSLLLSYDRSGVLPPAEDIEQGLTPLGLVRAVLEVWRAARPLADIARAGMMSLDATTTWTPGWRGRTSLWLRRMAGRLDASSQS